MSAKIAPSRATYADIERLPPNVVGEIIDGVLYSKSHPTIRHAVAASAILEELGPPFKLGRGGFRAEPFDAIELELAVLWAR